MTLRRGCLLRAVATGFVLIAMLGWCAWQGSDAALPPLARGLSGTFKVGEQQLNRRIAAFYPVGSSEQRLISDLERQGFNVTPARDSLAEADVRRFIGCGDKIVSIRWRARNGIITKIFGVYGAICL